MQYAGFLRRLVASFIDGLIFIPFFFIFSLGATRIAVGDGFSASEADELEFTVKIVVLIASWIYFAAMESSPLQSTLGKMAIGIKVTDLDGDQISFARATGRYFGKYISSFILLIGYFMAGFTAKKQGLHDIMAGTLVVMK